MRRSILFFLVTIGLTFIGCQKENNYVVGVDKLIINATFYDNSYSGVPVKSIAVPQQITGYEYQVEACMRAMAAGEKQCPEMPHSETLLIMQQMDELRRQWNMVYPFD